MSPVVRPDVGGMWPDVFYREGGGMP